MSMWIFRDALAERVQPPSHTVVEARADGQHHVAAMHREVGFVGAVHAQHAEELRIAGRVAAQTHQGVGDRKTGQPSQPGQRVRLPPARS